MKFVYFPGHGRGLPIRMALDYCQVDYTEDIVKPDVWPTRKPTFKYNQVPAMVLDDGTEIYQTKALLRYVARAHKGKNGENLYPFHEDPELMFKIDSIITMNEDEFLKYIVRFQVPFIDAYKSKDDHFIHFITGEFDKWLAKIDDLLNKSTGKYLFGDQMTLADISTGAVFLKLNGNSHFEHNLILDAIVRKYPRVHAYSQMIDTTFKDF